MFLKVSLHLVGLTVYCFCDNLMVLTLCLPETGRGVPVAVTVCLFPHGLWSPVGFFFFFF